jgi:nucleoside-diphosphate-sugar epimerase
MSVELNRKKEVISVTGNTCKRGEQYAKDECTNPVRMLTTTIKVNGGSLPVVPVTYADSEALERDYGFTPRIGIREGLRAFAEWFVDYEIYASLKVAGRL